MVHLPFRPPGPRRAPEGRPQVVRERDPDCLRPIQRGKLHLQRSVPPRL